MVSDTTNVDREIQAAISDCTPPEVRGFPQTDTGNAERFATRHGTEVRYCFDWKSWLAWDGRRWKRDAGQRIGQLVKHTVRSIAMEAFAEPDESDARGPLLQWAGKSESEHRRRAMERLAQSETGIAVTPDDLDTEPMLLTIQNGMLDLSDGELLSHDRECLSTKLAPTTYNPTAECPTWDAFLHRIMDGNEDLIAFLRRAVGYSLTGDTTEQCLFLLHGQGSNGKSVFVKTVSALLGDYARQASFDTFLIRSSQALTNDIASLRGSRFVAAVEAEQGRPLAESIVKALTGGDTVTVRFLFEEDFEFQPECKVWLATNHRPVIQGTDHAIWRRLRLIPFNVTIPDDEQDKYLYEKLCGELPGILNWAVSGCLEWQRDGLSAPTEVQAATAVYRDEQDIIGQFINDRCVIDEAERCSFRKLYGSYSEWAALNNEKPITSRTFGDRLTERGLDAYRGKGERWRIGVCLK